MRDFCKCSLSWISSSLAKCLFLCSVGLAEGSLFFSFIFQIPTKVAAQNFEPFRKPQVIRISEFRDVRIFGAVHDFGKFGTVCGTNSIISNQNSSSISLVSNLTELRGQIKSRNWNLMVLLAIVAFILSFNLIFTHVQAEPSSTIPDPSTIARNLHHECLNGDFVLYLQRYHFHKAQEEIFGIKRLRANNYYKDDMYFYQSTFGLTSLKLKHQESALNYTKIDYYSIFKSANANIKTLLVEYPHDFIESNKKKKENVTMTFGCPKEARHPDVEHIEPVDLTRNVHLPKSEHRFPFTFLRDPISRFIAAMSEVEWRAYAHFKKKTALKQPLGSQERVEEFIRWVLSTGGSERELRGLDKYQIVHVYPMINVYWRSMELEGTPIQLYRVENFDPEWKRLSEDVSVPFLNTMYTERRNKDCKEHGSSSDPYNTTLAAKSLFSYSSEEAFKRMQGSHKLQIQPVPKGLTTEEHHAIARKYYRAICHMYLMDFLCFAYPLPSECADIYEAAMVQVQKWREGSTMIEDELTEFMDRNRDVTPVRSEKDVLSLVSLGVFVLILLYYLFPWDNPFIQKLFDYIYSST